MATLKEKKLPQTLNIIDTLIEATDHFSGLSKEKNFNQSVYIFSSIVDGFSAIEKTLTSTQSESIHKSKKNIERSIHLIAKQMEQGNFLKIAEVVQFSLMPQLRELRWTFEAGISGEQVAQPITIGVYSSRANPRVAYPEERINAYIEEAERQGVGLIFFSSDDVDVENRQIKADAFKDNQWQKIDAPFPDVINNISPSSRIQQSRVERKLRRELPFTSFYVGNKYHLPKKLVKYRKYADLLVPFKVCKNENVIHDFMQDNKIVVFKPIMGRRGENIFFVEKRGNRYSVLDQKKEQVLGTEKFSEWISKVILKNRNSYMIQHYIQARTKEGEPYDIRAHVQKNGEGKWQLTRIYPRIGNRQSILSNISRGGRTDNFEVLLKEQFGKDGLQYGEEIRKLAIDLTKHLDKIHGLALDELGLDLAIDQNGRFWLHEVNNGPQSTFHETERASNTIAYATYIAKNGIVNTNESDKGTTSKGQFNALVTDLEWANLDNRYRIGMLVNENEVENLAVACAYVAKYEGVDFYYFSPRDIDFGEMLIRGHFYEDKEWVTKIVEYPDAIYDRLRLRGMQGYKFVYEELEDIPFTNEFFGNSISKLEVYDKLTSTGKIDDAIIPYQKVDRIKDIFKFINKYRKVILKPEVGSFAKGVHFIEKQDIDDFFVAVGEHEKYYNEVSIRNYLRKLIKQGTFIVQEYIETRTLEGQPFDIRVHMMKGDNGEWSIVNSYPRIGFYYAVISSTSKGGYIGELSGFLDRNFSSKKIKEDIKFITLRCSEIFDNLYDEHLSEIAFDIAIDKEMKVYIIEVNVNKPGIIYYDFEVAKHAIPYAISLVEKN
ncbi:YheC/YheD family protein [Lentibacillus sp. CBA3610]|uniref:YheC/YheD family protein n=1 Tax=Lentibacillus sp. CBA3610 TaxID=2518176 RepID=UPI00159546E8|nr:YheC/YheD family protein [Lentibacillus sp. CBA3610]QKY70999.1 hypothetical protein Len3610_16760 [Lentibacillus sp. CBA3610]